MIKEFGIHYKHAHADIPAKPIQPVNASEPIAVACLPMLSLPIHRRACRNMQMHIMSTYESSNA